MPPILDVRNITKRFPGVLANDQVSFALQHGEILAFLGENGAGKGTLMNILYGLYAQDEGDILVRGASVEIQEPKGAAIAGYALADCPDVFGDAIERVVAWKNGADVSALAGRPVRLRFRLRDADLYSFRFGNE